MRLKLKVTIHICNQTENLYEKEPYIASNKEVSLYEKIKMK